MPQFYRILIFFLSFLMGSCQTTEKRIIEYDYEMIRKDVILRGVVGDLPLKYELHDKTCTPERALESVGKVPIWVQNSSGEMEKLSFDFGESLGLGLVNRYTSFGVVYGDESVENLKGCKALNAERSTFYCEESRTTVLKEGKPVPFCRIPNNGYPENSIENIALVSMASYMKTMSFHERVSDKNPPKNIALLILPKFKKVIDMGNGTSKLEYDLDNARWTNIWRKNRWKYSIEILPRSLRSYQKKAIDFTKQFGVLSHETGHHIFSFLVPELKKSGFKYNVEGADTNIYVSYKKDSGVHSNRLEEIPRNYNLKTVVSALDEGFADMVSHYTFSSGLSPYYGFQIGLNESVRKVHVDEVKKELESNDASTEVKALSEAVIRHFFSSLRSFPPRNTILPDHQDVHTIGALTANAIDKLLSLKVGESQGQKNPEEKYRLLLRYLENIQDLYKEQSVLYSKKPEGGYSNIKSALNYNTGPALFLRDAMWEAVKLAFVERGVLSRAQCLILNEKFPVYVVNWRGQYMCQ